MKRNPLGRALNFAMATLCLAVSTHLGCGTPPQDPAANPAAEDPNVIDGQSPYPNLRGGEVKGDNNFADLINKYPQGTGDKGWAAFWWPYTANGIASGVYGGGGSHGGGQSPAGKYDAARGGVPQAQQWEAKNHGAGVPKVQGWWGHCNGWCASSSMLPEPREGVKVNGIKFGVADLKALLAEAGMSVDADFYGNRVDPWTSFEERRWEDTVPDQYFLVLTNYMGKAGRTVLIDRYTGDQIWNQPLAGYRFEYPKPVDSLGCTGGICKINVRSTIWWYNDSGVPATVITPKFNWQDESDGYAEIVQHRDMVMELWLDGPVVFGSDGKITSSGNVVVTHDGDYFAGGAWKMGYHNVDGNPDYMWIPYSYIKPDPTDDYANPYVDIDWIKAHLLVPGGLDDPTAHPVPVNTAPPPQPSPSPSTSPSDQPSHTPIPIPFPTHPAPTPLPAPTPHLVPQPGPTHPLE